MMHHFTHLADAALAACCCEQLASASTIIAASDAANRRSCCQSALHAAAMELPCCRWLSCSGADDAPAAQLLAACRCRGRECSRWLLKRRGMELQMGGMPRCIGARGHRVGAAVRNRHIRLCRLAGHAPQRGAAECSALCIAFTGSSAVHAMLKHCHITAARRLATSSDAHARCNK